jgi:hypothetical protein
VSLSSPPLLLLLRTSTCPPLSTIRDKVSAAPAGSRGEEAAVDRVGASSATLAELLMREEAGGALGLMACLKSNETEFGF